MRLVGVTKRFDDVVAVDDLSLDVESGSFFALLGPSGCGKTTTLRMIGGFEQPTEGQILLGDRDVSGLPPYKRDVNTVFQSYALFPHLSVFDNVAFGLRRRAVRGETLSGQVNEMLRIVGLEGMEKRKPRQLSGGQQQRVALARALVNHPDVLLLDEPLGALDLKLRKEMQLELKGLQERVGITFIYVTHDQEEALTMSDRIAVMSGGKVLQIGSPTEIYERPTCRFVADFIGESNFVTGRVSHSDATQAVVTTPDGLLLRGQCVALLREGAEAMISIRPEKAHLTSQEPIAGTPNVFPVTVERVSYIGSDTRILVRLGQERSFSVWEQNTRSTVDRDAYWQQGEQGYLSWPVENALVLTE
ncbi:MAG TPA: ABC transporter ATP-binding protein [Roseiflexaceae bacterium]